MISGRGDGILIALMDTVNLAEIVSPENIAVRYPAAGRPEVLTKLVSLLPVEGEEIRRAIIEAVLAREKLQPTGIGYGIAIPHGKAEIDAAIFSSIVLTKEPVDYGSVDGSLVSIFILRVSRPDVAGPHVQALASVARLLGHRQFREDLLAAETPEQVISLLRAGAKR